jgi:hypothetical protein
LTKVSVSLKMSRIKCIASWALQRAFFSDFYRE